MRADLGKLLATAAVGHAKIGRQDTASYMRMVLFVADSCPSCGAAAEKNSTRLQCSECGATSRLRHSGCLDVVEGIA
jgi:ribosomal protein S27AE